MGRNRRALGLPVALLLSAGAALAASSEATLAGKVLDGNGQPLPGATLSLRNDTLAFQERGTLSDSQGGYRFPHLPPGAGYRLTVSLPTYATVVFSDLTVESGRTVTQDVVLRPGTELKEVIRVQGKSETLDTEKVTSSTTFSSTFIAELPILGRNYQDILTLAPGVTDVNKTGNPNIHGARDTDVVTLVDGVSTTDPFTGYYGQNLNIESIQELEVITSAATAQYSRAQGGFASILTKSGQNEFQGTFKLFVRSDRLDGDGAGVEKADVTGGLLGDQSYTSQHFTDLMPFLSVSGAMVRDRLWYYLALEYIHEEKPVNAISQAFVTPVYGNREFGKLTWQLAPSQRLAFSLILDEQRRENLGINSLTDAQSGFYTTRGGPTLTLKESAVFKPTVLLESSLSWFDNRFTQNPTMNPDTNGNGILFVDNHPELGGNGDGILTARERDAGEDWDGDGFFDVYEDVNHMGNYDPVEDLDRDGKVSLNLVGCEGYHHEDRDCNGYLDAEQDANLNGRLDPAEDVGIPCNPNWGYCPGGNLPNTYNNGRFDTEDANGNGVLDVLQNSGYTSTPFWEDKNGNGYPDPGEYRAPLPPDQDLMRDSQGRYFGPSPYEFQDHRKRMSWLEDLSLYVPDLGGTHDLKLGFAYEHEGYDSDTVRRPNIFYPTAGRIPTHAIGGGTPAPPDEVGALLGIPAYVNNAATGDNVGLYLQDDWKPLPNLSLGLGLRYDYEHINSFGYSAFDPAAERRAFDAIMSVAGVDMKPYDNISIAGLCRDPLHSCGGSRDPAMLAMVSRLNSAAFGRFTRHNLDVAILSDLLRNATGGTANSVSQLLGYAVRPRQPEDFQIANSNLAPRLNLSWDPWADGKTMVFGSWGRYYGNLFLNTVTLEQGPDTVSRTYSFDPDGVSDRGFPDNHLGTPLFQSALSAFQVDRSLATPFSDEWTAGFRRELAPEVLVSLRYIHKNFHDQLQDIDVNHHTEIDLATGLLADRIGEARCGTRRDPCTNTSDGAPDLYINNYFFNRVFRLGNFNEQTYRAWEVEFVRRLKRKWQMEASYTYSVAEGDAESFLSELGDDPALVEAEPGFLSYDQRHVVKFNAIAFLPGDWRLGGTITWASGFPYSGIVHYDDSDDAGYTQSRIIFGQLGATGFGITPELRNIHRNAGTYMLNARVMKNFVIGKSAASAFLEVYNLLNSDSLRVVALDQFPASGLFEGSGGSPASFTNAPVSHVIGERDFGRRFQIGFQVDF